MNTTMWMPGWAGVVAAMHMRMAVDLMIASGAVTRAACLMFDRDKVNGELARTLTAYEACGLGREHEVHVTKRTP